MCDIPTSFPVSVQSVPHNGCAAQGRCGALVFPITVHERNYKIAKRCLDLLVASIVLTLLLPLFPILMLLVKCSSRGPAFYRHLRVGQYGRRFALYKFRTMWCDNETLMAEHLATDSAAWLEWRGHQKLRDDPRITPLGAFLRRFSLDELPQLWNVLTGDMSLVGPRPIIQDEIWRYRDAFSLYASVKPGLTGLWQVSGRGRLLYEERVALDVEYVRSRSLASDFRILLRTPAALREWPETL